MKPFLSRRQALQEAALGFGGLALTSMIARAAETPTYSLRPRQPHFPAKAKNVPKMESKIDASRNSATENLQMERISIDRVTYQLSNSE